MFLSVLRRSEAVPALKPLFDRVFVRRMAPKSQTAGGIMLPESQTDQFHDGIIVAVGRGARSESGNVIPNQLKAGDRVILPLHGGQKVKLDGQQLFVYKESEIVAVIE
ncbi:unnamed protein product [Bursaphelenchus okinawaensis]|uniref:10 kDa heat shock protein, mitochondrial n=1 Tax=Bursaphelenchus okinawaensis TaxID=465554 RepID=A0A811K5C4_9BILA|nr:unnamed protein product [Bursaphelenchus okinawaensis]CAG9092840.1 unnamed protein product [Bursaphelenchus okinawaensis]